MALTEPLSLHDAPEHRSAPSGPAPAAGGSADRRWVAPLLTGGALLASCAAVVAVDPGDGGTPVCLSKTIFGVDCPFCGGLRAANSMLRGHWFAAADHNLLLAVALPATAALWLVWMVQSLRGRDLRIPRIRRPVLWAGVALVVAFTVLRNLPVDSGWIHWLASGAA